MRRPEHVLLQYSKLQNESLPRKSDLKAISGQTLTRITAEWTQVGPAAEKRAEARQDSELCPASLSIRGLLCS
jgi:hypothetical protein